MAKTHEVVQFTIGGRTYDLAPFLEEDESLVAGDTMVERAQELGANLGEEDGRFILEHLDDIPQEYREFYLVLTNWRYPSNPPYVICLYWDDRRWSPGWLWLGGGWLVGALLLRRRT